MEIINKVSLACRLLSARYSKPKPITVHLQTTKLCNLACKYCYGSYNVNKAGDALSTDKWLQLVDLLHRNGTRRINLGGGEALLRKDIGELIDYIRKKNIVVNLNTNGHIVMKRLDVIQKLNTLCISIDGDEGAHDKSKGAGSYQKVIEAIKFAKKNDVVVHTITCMTRANINTIYSILEVAKKYGTVADFLFPFAQSIDMYLPSNEDIRSLVKVLIDHKERGYPIGTSYEALLYVLHWPDHRDFYSTKKEKLKFERVNGHNIPIHIPCYAGKFICHIDYDGYVYPCAQYLDVSSEGRNMMTELRSGQAAFTPLNYLEVGFEKAFRNAMNRECTSCYACAANNDYNLLLSGHFNTYLNYLKNSLTEGKMKH